MASLPTSLAAPIRLIAKQALGKDWQLYGILLDHWPTIIGDAWAESVHPVKLSFPNARQAGRQALCDGALTLRLPRGLTMEVQYQQPQILARINNFFGGHAITRLILTHRFESPPQKPPPRVLAAADQAMIDSTTDGIADGELRAALASLGTLVYAQRR